LLLLRARLLDIVAVATGNISLAATATGFTRAAGSFVADGFKQGMEVVPAGFGDNTPAIVNSVTANEIRTIGGRPVEAAAANRSLTVGIPPLRGWENRELTPLSNRWYIEEDYLPGAGNRIGVTRRSPIEYLPTYVIRLSGLAGHSVTALYTVAQAILDSFKPLTVFPMSDGHAMVVRGDPAPYRGQLLTSAEDPGRAEIVITIPLIKRSPNLI
jgi:hypothetical protein